MIAKYVHDGLAIDYTPAADVAAGDIVATGSLIGVARLDIKAHELGALAMTGVYDVAKADSATFALGAPVYWDADTNKACTTSSKPKLGIAIVAAQSADAIVRVRIG